MKNEDFFDKMFDRLDNAFKAGDEMSAAFAKLCLGDATRKIPKLNDLVIVAAGFVGLGHIWVRLEAEIVEIGESSYKVRFLDYTPYRGTKGSHEVWIHPALITDVLERKNA